MKDKIIKEMEEIYVRCSSGNSNYYDVLGLDPNTDLQTIRSTINRKYKIYFHPDQEAYIPSEYKATFDFLRDLQTDMENVFSSEESKKKYDQSLFEQDDLEDTMDLNNQHYSYTAMTEEDEDIIFSLKTTATKYGWDYANKALTQAIKYDNYKAFTRENDARDKISRINSDKLKQTIERRCKEENHDISFEQKSMDYVTYIYHNDRELMNKLYLFDTACQETVNKYNIAQAALAIKKVVNNSDFSSFTNKNNARDNFINSEINTKDLEFFMRIYLNDIRNENPSYEYDIIANCSFEQILDMYLNEKHLEKEKQYNNSEFTR